MTEAIALLVDEDDADETEPPSTCVLDDTPGAYQSMRRRAESMVTWALRSEERELRCRRHQFGRLDWVRLFAMRHELEDRGEKVPDL